MKAKLLTALAIATTASSAVALPYVVKGGQTNIDLDDPLLASINWGVSAVSGNISAAEGFDVAYPILPTSTFNGESSPFSITDGSILHTGTVTLTNSASEASAEVGDFSIDAGSPINVVDTFTTGAALFEANPTSVDYDEELAF